MNPDDPIDRRHVSTASIVVLIAGFLIAIISVWAILGWIGDPYQRGINAGTGLTGIAMPGSEMRWTFERGEYRIYYLYRVSFATFGNAPYSLPSSPPDISCSLVDADTGSEIPLSEPGSYRTYHTSLMDGTAIAAFRIRRIGAYLLNCKYADDSSGPAVMLYQGQITPITRIATAIDFAVPWAAGVFIMALALVAFALVIRSERTQPHP
jgi:hypothetical protein